jgi:hypothetical protein
MEFEKSVNNRTYVCFNCRTTERVPAERITKVCRKCREQAEHVYYKFKIPQRDDDVAWQKLQTKVRAVNRKLKSDALAWLRKERARLEQLLAEVPQSKQERRRSLRFKLKTVKEKTEQWNIW